MGICLKIAEHNPYFAFEKYVEYKLMFDHYIKYGVTSCDGRLYIVLYVEFDNEADLVIFLLTYNDQLNQVKESCS